MRSAGFWLCFGIILVLQIGFVPALRPFGTVPNLVMVFVVLAGMAGTASTALVAALIGGLLLDLTSGADFGLRMGILVLAALVTGLVHRAGFILLGPTVALAVVAAATVVENAAVLAGLAGAPTSWPFGFIVANVGLTIVLNLSLTMVMRPLMARITTDTSRSGIG